jgi:hypothetical protein
MFYEENTMSDSVSPSMISKIINVIAASELPKSRWSCSDDASGTALTLARQRKWTRDNVKAFLTGQSMSAGDVSVKKVSDAEVIDDDFDEAAAYYASTMFGQTKAVIKAGLILRYEKEEILDPLVWILARHRHKHVLLEASAITETSSQEPTPSEKTTPPTAICTCLTELQDDAYESGGPMSGQHRPPPCVLHTANRKG